MPSSIMYHKDPKAANRITWYILITVLLVTFISFLYSQFISNSDLNYEKAFYEKVSGIRVPATSKVIETYDNGEFWTGTSFRMDKDSLAQFIKEFGFVTSTSGSYPPTLIGASAFKVEKFALPQGRYLYKQGTKGKNSWVYILDLDKNILWAQVQYPDWAGD
jgi:hypothetical protein